jgi:hypothetical protein
VDAFIDTYGDGYVELALALGVAAGRIDTIADYAAAAKHGVKTDGGAEAGPGSTVLAELAGLIADGHLEVPIANVYPLAQVRDAYTELERRHTHGKIVSGPSTTSLGLVRCARNSEGFLAGLQGMSQLGCRCTMARRSVSSGVGP